MDEIEWGAEIEAANDGIKLGWLEDEEEVMAHWSHMPTSEFAGPYPVHCVSGWTEGFRIKLPANHPYYATLQPEFGPEIAVNGVRPEWLGDGEVIWATNRAGWEVNQPCAPESRYWPNVASIRLPATHWAYTPIAKGFRPWAGGDEAPGDWEPGSEVLFADGQTHDGIDKWSWYGGPEPRQGMLIIGYKPRTEPTPTAFKAGDYVVAGVACMDVTVGDVYRMVDDHRFADADGEPRPISIFDVRPATPAEIEQHIAERDLETAYSTGPAISGVEMVSLPMMTGEGALEWLDGLDYASPYGSIDGDVVNVLRHLGIIKPPADDLSRFLAETDLNVSEEEQVVAAAAIKWARENG